MIVCHFSVFHFYIFINFIASSLLPYSGVSGLQITEFNVPAVAKTGKDQQLICQYKLNNTETLYFLRWYKDGNEFFRYMPKETPPQRFYNVSGVRVRTFLPNSTNVILGKVDSSTSGIYRCEVSAEAPGFETADREEEFNVIEPPLRRPFITISHQTFVENVHETIEANCSGPESRIAPQHDWTLASVPVPLEKLSYRIHDGFHVNNWKQTTSTIHLPTSWIENFLIPLLKKSEYLNDHLRGSTIVLPLRCTSHLQGLFEDSDSVDIVVLRKIPRTPTPTVISGGRNVVKSAKSSTAVAISFRHGASTNNASLSSCLNFTTNILSLTNVGLILSTWLVHYHLP